MTVTFKYTEIKEAYLEVKKLLEKASGKSVNSLNTKIAKDLELWGDDNYCLLVEFVEKYNLNFERFHYDKYFYSELELFGFLNIILALVKKVILILNNFIIKYLSQKIYDKIDSIFCDITNEKRDLTFGDLLLSKLMKEFYLRDECRIELAK